MLTGDTATGKMHLGHYVGSLQNRVAMQEDHEAFVLVANTHAFSTRVDKPKEMLLLVIKPDGDSTDLDFVKRLVENTGWVQLLQGFL